MKLNVDKQADALSPRLDDSPIVEPGKISPGVERDYNEANEVVGVELLQHSKRSFSRETTEKVRQLVHGEAKAVKSVPMQVYEFA